MFNLKKGNKMLNKIVTTNENKAIKMLIYGVHGIGKSSFGASLPKPIFLQTEDGLRGKNFEGVPRFPVATSWQEVKDNLTTLIKEEHEYKSLIVDSVDWLERLIHKEVETRKGVDAIGDIGYSAGYRIAESLFSLFLDLLDELFQKKKMLICLLGHAEVKSYNPPDAEPYDRYQLDLHKWSAPRVYEWCDIACFVNYKTFVKKVGESFGKSVNKAVGKGDRVMYTEERPAFLAKNRFSLPSEMNFSWEELKKEIF